MKKFIALALVIIMMAAIAVPAMAADKTVDQDSTGTDRTPTTLVTFGVTDGYTVTVPATVEFGTNLFTETTVSAEDVIIPGNKVLQVKIASDTTAGKTAFTMVATNGSDPVEYKVSTSFDFENGTYAEATDVCTNGTVVLEVVSNQTDDEDNVTLAKSATLYFGTPGTNQSGDYSDTLTFSVDLADA